MVQVRTVSLIRATLVISRLMEIISSLNWKSALKRQLTDIKKTQWLRVSCQSRTRFGSVLDNSKTRTRAHWGHTASFTFLGLLWSPLLCTLIGPCGCHAVARPRPCCVVIGVCGAAAWRWYFDWQVWPPALPCLPTWRGRGWRGGEEVAQAGRGWALDVSRRRGVVDISDNQKGCVEICVCWTQGRFNRDHGDGIRLRFFTELAKN